MTADSAFASLENVSEEYLSRKMGTHIFLKDARTLEGLKKSADALLPDMEREYEELMRELEHEQAEVKEIEESDQDYLNELKATIAEQK